MKNRVDIKEYILTIEQRFPVNSWTANGIHLWPFIRIRLFFFLIDKLERQIKMNDKTDLINSSVQKSKEKKEITIFERISISISYRISYAKIVSRYVKWYLTLPSKKYLFIGADNYRVNYKNKRFNKYFDVLIDKYNIKSDSMYFEMDKDEIKNIYHSDIVKNYHNPFKGFLYLQKIENINFEWEGYDSFLEFLCSDNVTINFGKEYSVTKLESWFSFFWLRILFFKKVLLRINPKKVLILCYYWGDDSYALTIAANQLGIETIEMQHGPQTEIHLSYGNWSVVPNEGYDFLPRTYWNWDHYSQSIFNNWISNNPIYKALVVGNPWVDFWKGKQDDYKFSNYILYSLQPNPLSIEQLFPKVLIEFIKKSQYKWFLRLHPRQLDQKFIIEDYLMKNDIFHLVNIEDATNDPLPQLLANALIHFTHFSGSTIESQFFNVFTVLINRIGIHSFPDLIESKKAVFLDIEDALFSKRLNEIIQEKSIYKEYESYEHNKVKDLFVKQ
jgi:hypothetical protein